MSREEVNAGLIGKAIPQPDSYEKAVGLTRFSDDVVMKGMLYGKALRSPYANVKIKKFDVAQAKALNGIHAVLTAEDVPGANLRGNFPGDRDDQPVIVKDVARVVGDCLALVAGETEALVDEALALIEVEYERLPPVEDPYLSAKSEAPQLDERGNITADYGYKRGDVENGFAQAAAVVEQTFHTQCVEHAYLELEAGIAWIDDGGVVRIRCGTQFIENFRFVARVLGLSHNKVRIEGPLVGGGFGGKIATTIEHYLALLAYITSRPVRMALTREESMLSSTKRHPYNLHYKIGADQQGRLTALTVELLGDAGGYTNISAVIGHYALSLLAGPYRCPNVAVDSKMVITNNPIGTAMRGVGCAQITFALEGAMDMLAQKLGMDPLLLRERNVVAKGGALPTGQPLKNAVWLTQTWRAAEQALDEVLAENPGRLAGIIPGALQGRGQTFNMTGYGRRHGTISHACVTMQLDGSAVVEVGVPDIGSGQRAGAQQIAAVILGLPMDKITVQSSDSQTTPLVGMTAGSRQFMNTGNAVKIAAEPIAEALKKAAAQKLSAKAEDIILENGQAYTAGAPNTALNHGELVMAVESGGGRTTNLGTFTVQEAPYPGSESCHDAGWVDYTFGSMAVEVAVDQDTGQVTILGIGLSHDAGKVMNPQIVHGQCEGGVTQAMGQALMEDCCVSKGKAEAHEFSQYLIPTSKDMFPLKTVLLESGEGEGPFAARGIGEPPCNVTLAGISNAVSAAIGVRVTSLPITPVKVLIALETGEWPS